MGFSKIVETEVEIEITIDEAIEFLEDEGYSVVLSSGSDVINREHALEMINNIRDHFGGEIIETDYHNGKTINIPSGSTVLIVPGL